MKTLFNTLIITLCWASMLLANVIRVPLDQPTIQAGINAAAKGDTLLINAGTYYENINFKGKAITVASYFLMDSDTMHINNTIIDGSKPSHADSGSVVYFVSGEDTTSLLCGFTITNGSGTMYIPYAAQVGGGIFCDNSGCTILANKITNNKVTGATAYGAGFAAMPMDSLAVVILKDNKILYNTLTTSAGDAWGGGVALWLNGKLVNNQISYNSIVQNATDKQAGSGGVDAYCLNLIMESNKITHNSLISYSNQEANTAFGGGCTIVGATGCFTKNEISHNQIWIKTGKNAVGGGIEFIDISDSFIIDGNNIINNAVVNGIGWGGGIGFYNCSPLVVNNIISRNSVTKGGGALFIALNAKVQLINNTIINNQAYESGGGLYVISTGAPVIMNSIIWNNQAPDKAAIYIDVNEGATVKATYCDIQGGWEGDGNINSNPCFADSFFNLSDSSYCVGNGISSIEVDGNWIMCPKTDYYGKSRPHIIDEFVDMGAIESPHQRVPVGFEESDSKLLLTYKLIQNYPNPFNPSTIIEFTLPKSVFVELKVYTILGKEISTLVSKKLNQGNHTYTFDGTNLASGIYYYQLIAGDYREVKKMILLR